MEQNVISINGSDDLSRFGEHNSLDSKGLNNSIIVNEFANVANTHFYVCGYNNIIHVGKCIIKSGIFWIEGDNNIIKLGDDTTVERAGFLAMENNTTINIGFDCMISHDVTIRTSDSHSIVDINTNERINMPKDVHIGNHVWIGAYCDILKGVDIGDNSIIGIRSLVTKNVSNNVIVGGVPAKVLRENITWYRDLK